MQKFTKAKNNWRFSTHVLVAFRDRSQLANLGRVANPRPVATIKTGRVAKPITGALLTRPVLDLQHDTLYIDSRRIELRLSRELCKFCNIQ